MPEPEKVAPAPASSAAPAASMLSPAVAGKVPEKHHPLVHQLHELSHKDRAKVLNLFGRKPGNAQTFAVKNQNPQMVGVIETHMNMSMWQGPLPPPEQLERYNTIMPNAAERLFAMAERQAAHRMQMEEVIIRSQQSQSQRGQFFGLLIGLGGIGLSAFFEYMGNHVAAGSVATVVLGGLAATFIVGKAQTKQPPPSKPPPDSAEPKPTQPVP